MRTRKFRMERAGWLVVLTALSLAAQAPAPSSKPLAEGEGYRIDQPGTITFTTGIKIKGKVEKPQVMIFLPKARPEFRRMSLSHSFGSDIDKPLPFVPIATR